MKALTSVFSFIARHGAWTFLILFLLFVSFVDSNSLWERHYTWENIENLEKEIQHYRELYQRDSARLAELENNPRQLEKVAREHYYMKRPYEDLFIMKLPK